jgi:hypothetical protein
MTEQDIIDICNKLGVKYIDGFLTYNGLLIGRSLDRGRVDVIRDGYCNDPIRFEESLKNAIVKVKEFQEKQKIRQMEADFE